MNINFSHLGNLILGVAGSISLFLATEGYIKTAATVAAIGVLGKAVCSSINEYQLGKDEPVPDQPVPPPPTIG